MLDDTNLGGFVDVLNSRRFLCSILITSLFIGVSACSEPDERLPWPTLQQDLDKLPEQAFSRWNSGCMDEVDTNTSIKIEVSLFSDGEFEAAEYHYNGLGCARAHNGDSRTRKGKIDEISTLSTSSWAITAHMHAPYYDGDLVKARVKIKMVDGQAHIQPISAHMFDITDQVPKAGPKDDLEKTWVFDRINDEYTYKE